MRQGRPLRAHTKVRTELKPGFSIFGRAVIEAGRIINLDE